MLVPSCLVIWCLGTPLMCKICRVEAKLPWEIHWNYSPARWSALWIEKQADLNSKWHQDHIPCSTCYISFLNSMEMWVTPSVRISDDWIWGVDQASCEAQGRRSQHLYFRRPGGVGQQRRAWADAISDEYVPCDIRNSNTAPPWWFQII